MNDQASIKSNTLPEIRDKEGWPWVGEVNPQLYESQAQWPKISIITPSYNQGAFIEETIRSILLQNYPNLEYIVIDGGSTDETVEILEKYDKWINYWVSEKDEGQSNAINKGLAIASGDLFNWLNSDDFLEPNALYEIGKNFTPDTLAVCGFCNRFDSKTLETVQLYQISVHDTLEKTLVFCDMNQPATYLNLAKVKEVGAVNEKFHYTMDLELWIKLVLRNGINGIVKIGQTLTNFRVHAQSKGVYNSQQFKPEAYSIYLYLAERFISDTNFVEQLKVLTNVSYIQEEWGVDQSFSKERLEREIRIRFYPVLIYHYSLLGEFHTCRSLFKQQLEIVGWEPTFSFFKEFFKYMLIPLPLFIFFKRLQRS